MVALSCPPCCCNLVTKSCPTLLQPHGQCVACLAPLSMGFSRQEYWNVLPFPSPGDPPNPGIESMSLALVGGFSGPPGEPSHPPLLLSSHSVVSITL